MTAAHATNPHAPAHAQPPYLAGDRVQILYMSERGTVVADARVTAVSRRDDGSYGLTAVLSDARASFRLVPAPTDPADDEPAHVSSRPGPGHVTYGVDHTKPTE